MSSEPRGSRAEADGNGLDLETAKAARSVWATMNDLFGPDGDFTRIVETVEKPAGVTVRTAA